MSYLTCTNCGQKSPGEATKCQHCGRTFGRPPERPGDSGTPGSWIPIAVLLAGAALAILAAYELWPRFSVAPPAAPPDTATVAAPPPAPVPAPKESRAAPVDTVRAAAPSPSRPPEQSRPSVADTAQVVAPAAPAAPPESLSIDVAYQRYAQVWANLRAERSNTAPVLVVLHPGEVVAVDSLEQGWYRVVTEQQTVGYVFQEYLDTLPPR